MRYSRNPAVSFSRSLVFTLALLASTSATAQREQVVYTFGSQSGDGALPRSGLIADSTGDLYGTTEAGGASGSGTIYELSPAIPNGWTETVLYSFSGGGDGDEPLGSLILDTAGNLYGTTYFGGNPSCLGGCGTVFELTPPEVQGGKWTITTLYTFNGGNDAAGPTGGLVFDQKGNLYGTTSYGGGVGNCDGSGCGTVFELSPPALPGGPWTDTILYSFTGGSDGKFPSAPVVFDDLGNLYGTANQGGSGVCGCGVVFELTAAGGGTWAETVLHTFSRSGNDGDGPTGSLLLDKAGQLAGTTAGGGAHKAGTVFGMQPPHQGGAWTFAVLYSFGASQTDGVVPLAGVILVNNMLYGTTANGGQNISGTAFQLTRTNKSGVWKETGLYSFKNGADGAIPRAELIFHNGVLYGTTGQGGSAGNGTIFSIGR